MASLLVRVASPAESGYMRREHQGSAFQAYASDGSLRTSPLFLAAQQALREVQTQVQQQRPTLPAYEAPVEEPAPQILRLNGPSYVAAAPYTDSPVPRTDTASPRVKLPVVCNDVRGVVFLDQQVVSCFCSSCNARVMDGHDRPLFSFTRFERHTGSKAKKWRLSLRIQPGSVPECPPTDPPMPLGQWLELRGYTPSGQRAARDDASSDSDVGGGTLGRVERRPLATRAPATPPDRTVLGAKRPRPGSELASRDSWLAGRVDAFASASSGSWRDRHRAVFGLVFGVLESDRELFHSRYMPWLNDLGLERLEQEFHTLHNYLALAEEGEDPPAVREMIAAYVRAVVSSKTTTSSLQRTGSDGPRRSSATDFDAPVGIPGDTSVTRTLPDTTVRSATLSPSANPSAALQRPPLSSAPLNNNTEDSSSQ